MSTPELMPPEDVDAAKAAMTRLLDRLGTVILGQTELLERTVVCLVARGHLLLEGLPGLGKTELVKSLSGLLGLEFRRVQFTPDLLPGDILGSPILEERDGGRQLVFHPGPVFTNLLLADEINRATPKTQSALLEAMQERRVTVLGETRDLPVPFFVLATQNPIELEGTYPLPEAQLDRFTFKISVHGVSSDVLRAIVDSRGRGSGPVLEPVLSADELNTLFETAERVHLPEAVLDYLTRLVAATHPGDPHSPETVKKYVKYGASPRAAIALARTSRAAALLRGKSNVGFDEVRFVAPSVLGHRMILDYAARLEDWGTAKMVDHLLREVPEIDRRIPEDLRV